MNFEMLLVGFAIGAALMYLGLWLDRFIFGPPSAVRTLERAKREAYFRKYAREEALRQGESGRT